LSVLRRVAARMSHAVPLESLRDIVGVVGQLVPCDSCCLYVLQGSELVLHASKNPPPGLVGRLKLTVVESMSGWASTPRELAVISRGAGLDPRFKLFNELPQCQVEAFLSMPLVGRGRLVGALNVQSRAPHEFSGREIGLVSALGYFAGAEIEMARLEGQNAELSKKIETRTLVERAKGILQADLRITEQEAYQKLQRKSQQMRRSMKQIAEAVVLGHALRSQGQA
jgi:GAF domain-containing protein